MQRDRLYDLLTEIRDERCELIDVIDLFMAVDDYLVARDGHLNNYNDPVINDSWQRKYWAAESELKETLEKMNLDFDTYEFNTED